MREGGPTYGRPTPEQRLFEVAKRMSPGTVGGLVRSAAPVQRPMANARVHQRASDVLVLDASPGITSDGYRAVSVKAFPLATSSTTYYTCPADRRALATVPRVFNGAGANRQVLVYIGTTAFVAYQLSTGEYANPAVMLLLEPGDLLKATADGADVNALFGIKEIALGSNDIEAASVVCGIGDTTIFTCPAGYSATLLDDYGELSPGVMLNAGSGAGSGAATLKIGVVPAGGSVSYLGGPSGINSFLGYTDPTLALGATLSLWGNYLYLGPGDTMVVNSDVVGINTHTIWRLWPEP